jgi:hypothetical protein
MAPRRPSPLNLNFAKNPSLKRVFSTGGSNSKSRGRAGAGLAPPPAGPGLARQSWACAPAVRPRPLQERRRALQERRRGRAPSPDVPHRPSPHRPPRPSSPPSAPWRRVGLLCCLGSPCRWGGEDLPIDSTRPASRRLLHLSRPWCPPPPVAASSPWSSSSSSSLPCLSSLPDQLVIVINSRTS